MKKHIQPFNFQLSNFLTSLIFYLAILVFIISFNFSDTPPLAGGWYQQWMPNLGGRQISDITFEDSLKGWAVTPYLNVNDTSYVLKTTNGGDNWFIQHIRIGQFVGSNRVVFLNAITGFTAGVSWLPTYSAILKTTNGGNNWFNINPPTNPFTAKDISIVTEDTIWVVSDNGLTGGVYFTSNGGGSWTRQLDLGSQNPNKIYMFNARIGFIAKNTGSSYIRKTTNSGLNWDTIVNGESFTDMFFTDSLIGWKADMGSMKKTINGGNNWVNQQFPVTYSTGIIRFSNVNKDTIWGGGGIIAFPNSQLRGLVYKTTNGGNNWGYQIPDTTIHIPEYFHNKFTNNLNGWAYATTSGIHTVTGGDSITYYTSVKPISNNIPNEYILFQNYPNPFNPVTKIKYQLPAPWLRQSGITNKSYVEIIVNDITGKEVITLVSEEQTAGTYEAEFSGVNYSSGIYFYSLIIDGKVIDTHKMILLK